MHLLTCEWIFVGDEVAKLYVCIVLIVLFCVVYILRMCRFILNLHCVALAFCALVVPS